MGFTADDVAIIRSMVEHHLLLSETATRRDLSDPETAENVAALVGDPLRLELLRALTEADSLATGPSAWSPWKESLIDELVRAVAAVFAGRVRAAPDDSLDERYSELLELVRVDGRAAHQPRAWRRLRHVGRRHRRPARPVRQDRRHVRRARHRRRQRRRVDQCRRHRRRPLPRPSFAAPATPIWARIETTFAVSSRARSMSAAASLSEFAPTAALIGAPSPPRHRDSR